MDLLNTFTQIPEILNYDLSPETAANWIKNEFEEKLGFDYVMLGYLNSESIDIKAVSELDERIIFINNNIQSFEYQEFIRLKKGITKQIKSGEKTILNDIGIEVAENCNIVLLPLIIKEAIFGIILGVKFGKKKISEEDFAIAQAYAGICSYVIKDAELSNVFKLQLKILNENIAEKSYAIDDIKEQNEKIKEAEKLKTEFLMNMSHSLRTPLNAIIGFSEALQMKIFGELNPKQEEYIIDIQNSGKEMLGLVNDILDMSKIEAGAMKVLKTQLDVNLLIREEINIVQSLAGKKSIKVKPNLPAESVFMMLDAQKFNQIMYNLLNNAIKFTNENGNIEVGLKELKNKVQIYVKDDGIGIDKKYQGKIFGKFEQIDNCYSHKYASTGLGLTITKELVEMHGGKIWVESKVNNGTTFTFELPID